MKRPLFPALLLALALSQADTSRASDAPPAPLRHGYALDNPDLLLRQRIFGIAHGVHLLYSACLSKEENAEAVQQAYEAWHPSQEKAIVAAFRSLAAHHFVEQAAQARWQDVARLFDLKETIYPSLGAISLHDACASFPEALRQSRYDFAAQLESPPPQSPAAISPQGEETLGATRRVSQE